MSGHRDPERVLRIRHLKESGETYRSIGRKFGLTRQAIHGLIKIRTKKPDECESCGETGNALHGHHINYITDEHVFLCVSCHRKQHEGVACGELPPKSEDSDSFKTKLRRWRAKRTQESASKLIGVPLSTYRNWEQGRNTPTKFTRHQLIEVTETKEMPDNVSKALKAISK